MASYLVNGWIIIFILFLLLAFLGIIVWLALVIFNFHEFDIIIMLDNNLRWYLIRTKLMFLKAFRYRNGVYNLDKDAGLISEKGKSLYIFNEGKPTPLKITKNSAEWLGSETLLSMINNEILKMITRAVAKMDIFIIIACIGSVIACLLGIVQLLIHFGVIK